MYNINQTILFAYKYSVITQTNSYPGRSNCPGPNTQRGFACFFGRPHLVELLLEAKADPEVRNARGKTPPLATARCSKSQRFPVDFLLKRRSLGNCEL